MRTNTREQWPEAENEVTSDYHGVVTEILVENGEAVQYEQRLMLIDTAGGTA